MAKPALAQSEVIVKAAQSAVSGAVAKVDLLERRRVVRSVPAPTAVELDDEIGWDLWHQTANKSD